MKDKNSFNNMLAENIQRLRKNRGLLIEQLASKICVSSSYLSRLEQGKRKSPSISIVVRLSKFFGVSIDSLIFGIDNSEDQEIRDVLQEIGLKSNEAEILEEIIEFIITLDWTKEEERTYRMEDLFLLIDKLKGIKQE